MLAEFGPDIWTADGPTVKAAAGFHYPTRMAVMRLATGDLVLWSPTAISDPLRREVEALGTVRHLVPPNALHHVFLGDWQRAYPEARVHAPPGLREKRPDIRFDSDLADGPAADWANQIDIAVLWGNRITTEVVFFHRQSRTAVFADLLQQFPPGWFRGWRGIVARLDRMMGGEPAVPRKFRLAFTDRQMARAALRPVLDWPAKQVLVAHGRPVVEDGQAFLRRAFGWLIAA